MRNFGGQLRRARIFHSLSRLTVLKALVRSTKAVYRPIDPSKVHVSIIITIISKQRLKMKLFCIFVISRSRMQWRLKSVEFRKKKKKISYNISLFDAKDNLKAKIKAEEKHSLSTCKTKTATTFLLNKIALQRKSSSKTKNILDTLGMG